MIALGVLVNEFTFYINDAKQLMMTGQ